LAADCADGACVQSLQARDGSLFATLAPENSVSLGGALGKAPGRIVIVLRCSVNGEGRCARGARRASRRCARARGARPPHERGQSLIVFFRERRNFFLESFVRDASMLCAGHSGFGRAHG
jgi:hypothetical protein